MRVAGRDVRLQDIDLAGWFLIWVLALVVEKACGHTRRYAMQRFRRRWDGDEGEEPEDDYDDEPIEDDPEE